MELHLALAISGLSTTAARAFAREIATSMWLGSNRKPASLTVRYVSTLFFWSCACPFVRTAWESDFSNHRIDHPTLEWRIRWRIRAEIDVAFFGPALGPAVLESCGGGKFLLTKVGTEAWRRRVQFAWTRLLVERKVRRLCLRFSKLSSS